MAVETITTITSQAGSYDLVDLDAVKDELGFPASDTANDDFLSRAISQVSAAIAAYCRRVFAAETVQDVIYSRLGEAQLQLSRFPAISITSATISDGAGGQTALVANTDYTTDLARGWLLRLTGSGTTTAWYTAPTTVIYRAGYADIPYELQQAAIRMITARFRNKGRDPTLRSQSQPGAGDQTYWIGPVPGSSGPFPDDVLAVLDVYRVPLIG